MLSGKHIGIAERMRVRSGTALFKLRHYRYLFIVPEYRYG